MTKTNAMRMLDKAKIPYEALEYKVDDSDLSGVTIAQTVGLDCSMVFKTLVAKGDKTGPLVMCIPADKEIDLKTLPLVGVRQFVADPADPNKQIVVYRLVKDYVVEK